MSEEKQTPEDSFIYIVYTRRGPKIVTRKEWEDDWLSWYDRINRKLNRE